MPRDDRDQNFEKALAHSLRSSPAADNATANAAHSASLKGMPGDDCLDAEILAAYHERLLDPEEMAQRKAHLASCERCQEILAQLEATDRIAVEADRDLMLDQVILDLPESSAPETLASESIPAGASSESVSASESTPEPEPAPEFAAEPEPEFEIEHEPDLVAASAALPSIELSRAAAASSPVPAPMAAAPKIAPKTAPSSATITFRPQRSERPKLVRFVALAGALAAGLIFWLVFRDHPNTVDLAQNHAPGKIELPPQSPAAAPSAEANESAANKQKDATSDNASVRGDAPAQAKNSVSPAEAQQLPLQPRSTADNVTNSLDDAKKTIDSAKALQEKSRTGAAAGKPVFTPRDEPSPDNGIYSARAVPQKSSDSARRKLDAVIGTSAVGGLTNASTASGSSSAPAANSPSGIPATPPPARTKMVPGVVSDAVTLEAASPSLQKSASTNQPAFINKDESPALSKSASGRVVASLTPLSVPAPSGTTIWRIGQAGMIQRSTNSGATWSIQPSGIVTDLIAGSAYSDQVCWLVGRNGTILRTTNGGATWQKLASPSNVDLLYIFSINADSATITDAAGRAFETTTAGSHWSRTKLQE